MKKWLMGLIGGKVIAADIFAANEYVRLAELKINTDADGSYMVSAFADGIDFIIENLTNKLESDRDKVFNGVGFDNGTLDDVYRYLLGGAEKVAPMLQAPSSTAQYEGLKMSFGCLVVSHLYRLRFLETQVSGDKLDAVRIAIQNVSGLMRNIVALRAANAGEAL